MAQVYLVLSPEKTTFSSSFSSSPEKTRQKNFSQASLGLLTNTTDDRSNTGSSEDNNENKSTNSSLEGNISDPEHQSDLDHPSASDKAENYLTVPLAPGQSGGSNTLPNAVNGIQRSRIKDPILFHGLEPILEDDSEHRTDETTEEETVDKEEEWNLLEQEWIDHENNMDQYYHTNMSTPTNRSVSNVSRENLLSKTLTGPEPEAEPSQKTPSKERLESGDKDENDKNFIFSTMVLAKDTDQHDRSPNTTSSSPEKPGKISRQGTNSLAKNKAGKKLIRRSSTPNNGSRENSPKRGSVKREGLGNMLKKRRSGSSSSLGEQSEPDSPLSKTGSPLNCVEMVKNDFTKGDKKIGRAIGRTAIVNACIFAGRGNPIFGFITGGAITVRRLKMGYDNKDNKEMSKALAVYGCATSASSLGQATAGAILFGGLHAALAVGAPFVLAAGMVSGITCGALSEWGVDAAFKKKDQCMGHLEDDHHSYVDSEDEEDLTTKTPGSPGSSPKSKKSSSRRRSSNLSEKELLRMESSAYMNKLIKDRIKSPNRERMSRERSGSSLYADSIGSLKKGSSRASSAGSLKEKKKKRGQGKML